MLNGLVFKVDFQGLKSQIRASKFLVLTIKFCPENVDNIFICQNTLEVNLSLSAEDNLSICANKYLGFQLGKL